MNYGLLKEITMPRRMFPTGVFWWKTTRIDGASAIVQQRPFPMHVVRSFGDARLFHGKRIGLLTAGKDFENCHIEVMAFN